MTEAKLINMTATWTCPLAEKVYDLLQEQIGKAFEWPQGLNGAPPAVIENFKHRQYEATEMLRRQATELYTKFVQPRILVKRNPDGSWPNAIVRLGN